MPLPKGKIRVYKEDEEDKSLEFIGEDRIDHTPENEKVEVYIGDAFDIVGERTQTDFKLQTGKNEAKESFKITLRNHKKESVQIKVVENLYRWLEWKIVNATSAYTKKDARTIEFLVNMAKDAENTIGYTVEYRW